jgi:hypothetical protein
MPVVDKDLIKAVVQQLSGITNVWWSHDPQWIAGDIDRAQIVLKLRCVRETSIDNKIMVTDDPAYPPGTSYDLTVGDREIKVEIKATVYDGGAEAIELIDAIRTGFRQQDVRDLLDGSNLTYTGMSTVFDRHLEQEDREVCMAAAEMSFNGVAELRTNFYHPDDTIRAALAPASITNGGWVESITPAWQLTE